MKNKWLIMIMSVISVGLGLLLIQGCEDEEDSDIDSLTNDFASESRNPNDTDASTAGLNLSPESASITRIGQQFTFTAQGGQTPYSWSISDSSAGTLSVNENTHYATYTVKTKAENEIIVQDNKGVRASATLDITTTGLSITMPTSLKDNTTYTCVASGGLPPYAWYNAVAAYGTLTTAAGTTNASYKTALGATNVTDTISIVDSNGEKISIDVNITD